MNSLVLELQSDALDPSVSVLNLLRKASLVAYKLNVQELQKWVNLELKGYEKKSQLPKYRFVSGKIIAYNPVRCSWIPVVISDLESATNLSIRPVYQPISQLEDFISCPKSEIIYIGFPKEIELNIIYQLCFVTSAGISTSITQIKVILEAVKDIILTWSLKLEKDGILGEGMTFSTKEKEVAHNANYHIKNLYNYSHMENTMSETNINQSNSSIGVGVNQGKVKTKKLAGTINEAQSQNLAQAAADIQQLLEQLQKNQNIDLEDAQHQVAKDLVAQAKSDSTFRTKLIKWGQSLGDTVVKTSVSEAVKGVIKLALALL